MKNTFGSFCDGLFVDMCVNTQLELPDQRDTVLAFFERIQKRFGPLNNFSRRDDGEFVLEEEKQGRRTRWVVLESDRLSAGAADPDDFEEAYQLQREVLQVMPYMLSISPLDIESLDITFTMDFDYQGNHDEVIAEALLGESSLSSFFDIPGSRAVSCSPSIIASLSEDGRLQSRVAIESRTSPFERAEKYKSDEPISIYFTIRRYPLVTGEFDSTASFDDQCRLAEQLMFEKIIPNFAKPLSSAIAQRR